MTIRTTRTTVSFSSPFILQSLEGIQPAGEYVVLLDDELIEGLSWTAYRRVATLLQTPAISASQRQVQSFSISQTELDAALMKDRHKTALSACERCCELLQSLARGPKLRLRTRVRFSHRSEGVHALKFSES